MPKAVGLILGENVGLTSGEGILEGFIEEIKGIFCIFSGALHFHKFVPVGLIKRGKVRC